MNGNFVTITKDEYDKLKRAEIALEIIQRKVYKYGYSYGQEELEIALRLVYNDEITQLKAEKDAEIERRVVKETEQREFPELPSEVVNDE
jgi:hypothetical protein